MSDFKIGEVVDVATKGLRVVGEGHDEKVGAAYIKVAATINGRSAVERVYLEGPSEITRVAPAEWPPRPGDLWRDRDGGLWFAMEPPAGDVILNGYDGGRHGVDYVNDTRGPLSFVWREKPKPGVDDEENPKAWTDSNGWTWDLRANYADRDGKTWHWAGGFDGTGDEPMEPLWSRDDWSFQDIPHRHVVEDFGPLALVRREEANTHE